LWLIVHLVYDFFFSLIKWVPFFVAIE